MHGGSGGGGGGGGLFGDLPTAKSESRPRSASTADGVTGAAATNAAPGASSSVAASKGTGGSGGGKSVSLVESLGNAGTTVAFVPTALRRKKPSGGGAAAATAAQQPGGAAKRTRAASESGPPPSMSSPAPVVPTDVHNQDSDRAQRSQKDAGSSMNELRSAEETRQDSNAGDQQHQQQEAGGEGEPEFLRLLHSSVRPEDRYDPHVPNDYLAHRERLKADRARQTMEREAREQLEVQRRVRERIEEERRAAEATGDLDKIVESRIGTVVDASAAAPGPGLGAGAAAGGAGRGRGRGRGGATNLPAWLVKKQKEEREKAAAAIPTSEAAPPVDPAQFQDDPVEQRQRPTMTAAVFGPDNAGRLVVLGNVDPSDVDDELADEVKEECEGRCGQVGDVRVRPQPAKGEVQVYVLFKSFEDASRAPSVFNGRSFGKRRIWARMARDGDWF